MTDTTRYLIPVILLMCFAALFSGMLSGLNRMGWLLIKSYPELVTFHGPLMVSGFLGTLISLERAKGLENNYAYLSPLLTGAGAVLLLTGISHELSKLMITAGSFGLIVILVFLLNIQFSIYSLIMTAGAMLWLGGNLLWLVNAQVPHFILLWISFLVVMIGAERLELSRIVSNSFNSRISFIIIISVLILGTSVSLFDKDSGFRITGFAMIALSSWLLLYDISRRTIFSTGLSRFMAACLLTGYIWLAAGGTILLISGDVSGFLYDAMLHSIFLGFVFSMIFAHAPVIVPAVLESRIKYMPVFYIHLTLLHITLVLRITGDLWGLTEIQSIGGLLNVIVIFVFIINTLYSAYSARLPSGLANQRLIL